MNAGDIIADRFRLERQLGAGGLGVVWEASLLRGGELVAIKFLKSPTGATMRRFEVEARALARMQHPGCVGLHEFGRTADNVPYLVMEHVEGQDMSSLRGQQIDVSRFVDILEQLLRALNYAHSRGIAHRDLKPENIITTPSGELKVLDFGLAKVAELDSASLTETGEVFGTPIYMSPEQLRGSKDAGAPSDIYALGAIGFELLMGRPPYTGSSMVDLAMGHLGQIPPEIERGDCPVELKRLIADMLAKEPRDRPTARTALARVNPDATQFANARPMDLPSLKLAIGLLIAVAIVAVVAAVLVVRGDEDAQVTVREPPTPPSPQPIPTRAPPKPVAAKPPPRTCPEHEPGLSTMRPGMHSSEWDYYVPDGSGDRPRPVVVVFPTDRVSPSEMFGGAGLDKQADEHDFLLLSPREWAKHIPDVVNATFKALDALDERTCIDRDRIYVIGHASGGNSTIALGCQPEIAAIATASYNPPANVAFLNCLDPQQPVPAIHLAPSDSGHAPFDGTSDCRVSPGMPVPDFEAAWRQRNQCSDAKPRKSKHQDGRCQSWSDCAAPFTSCHIEGGHDWPGVDSKETLFQHCIGGPTSFPSTDVVIDFLLQQRRRSKGCGDTDFKPEADKYYQVDVGGVAREMWMSVPIDYDPNRPYPVLLVVAYADRSPDQYVNTRAEFGAAVANAGYITIAPIPAEKNTPWSEPEDDEFLRKAVDIAADSLCIDRSRVFGISHADGATRLAELACEVPFSALALTGVAELAERNECDLIGPPPTIRVVGRDDPYVPILGGRGCDKLVRYLSADESDEIWTQHRDFGCRKRKEAWPPRPDECETWQLCETPYVSCRVDGGRSFGESDLATLGTAVRGCEQTKNFDLQFEKTILPFFDKHGRPIP